MRTLTAILLLIITNSIVAQKNFEGKIIYKMNSNGEAESTIITAYFGNQKIKVVFKQLDSIKNKKDDLLIDFNNGVVNYIIPEKNTYRTIKLSGKEMDGIPALNPFPQKNKQVLGYNSTAYITTDTGKNIYMAFTPFYFWYADSIYFKVKDEYRNIEMVPIFTNGSNIGMGTQMNLGSGRGEVYIEITPVSIIRTAIADSVFSLAGLQLIPKESSAGDSSQFVVDSVSVKMQEAADKRVEKSKEGIKDNPEKSPSKKPSSKNTHKQPTKHPATKSKD